MRYYLDTEFIEEYGCITLISIGVVAEDGREFYAVSNQIDLSDVRGWLWENVMPHLPKLGDSWWMTNEEIKYKLLDFVGYEAQIGDSFKDGKPPEFWGYYADYDWVAICGCLFERMVDLPKGWPMYCNDLKQLADSLGNPELPKVEGDNHNALHDARRHKAIHEHLAELIGVG